MDISALSRDDTSPPPGSLQQWLGAHAELAQGVAAAWVGLIEPLNNFAAVKSLVSGRYVFASAGLAQLFAQATLVGSNDSELMRAEEAVSIRRVEQAVMAQQSVVVSEHRLELGGRRREFTVTRIALNKDFLLAVWHERTEERHRESHLQRALLQIEQQQKNLEQVRRELQQGSGRDDLSGLYLRAQFDDQLLREIDLSTREHREFALVIIALDPLPANVEQIGAEANERLLEGMGRMLRANTRAMDAACRIGETHFAVLLSGVGLATAHARMEQLRRQCATQIIVTNGLDMGLSLSMGVSSFPHTASKKDELQAASEAAVAEAQRRGGNQVVLASISFEA
ncbi:GGDEF domain-containing protein [Paucibacter sp. KCTC 42545]|uniref:GGDEF domain-containing protein n=1 Tax=Paucibacter sp. KCTC 42545 TaxID=1768242 RepID=UPI000733AE10|nr:GGDEF domain-containing protein [Paucibacter sp. KCTC 42545]ALT77060.1 hypothetical protein AT984_07515 [Paucibacter sp. KCTC 42545]